MGLPAAGYVPAVRGDSQWSHSVHCPNYAYVREYIQARPAAGGAAIHARPRSALCRESPMHGCRPPTVEHDSAALE